MILVLSLSTKKALQHLAKFASRSLIYLIIVEIRRKVDMKNLVPIYFRSTQYKQGLKQQSSTQMIKQTNFTCLNSQSKQIDQTTIIIRIHSLDTQIDSVNSLTSSGNQFPNHISIFPKSYLFSFYMEQRVEKGNPNFSQHHRGYR